MFFTRHHGESHIQLTLRIPRRWGKVLNPMRKAGRYASLNCLVYSIIAEIVDDELSTLDEAPPNGSQHKSVTVASAIK